MNSMYMALKFRRNYGGIGLAMFLGFCIQLNAQVLTEVKNIRIYEHHSSNTGSGFGERSAYDFVRHQYVLSVHPQSNPSDPTYLADAEHRDLLEYGGPYATPDVFGWTSATSDIWGGTLHGNDLTIYMLKNDFDYENGNANDIADAFTNNAGVKSVRKPTIGDIYLVRIRDTEQYAAMKITEWEYNNDQVYFTFDYKYGEAKPIIASIRNQDLSASLRLFPNPAGESLNVDCSGKNCKTMSIHGVDGVQYYSGTFKSKIEVTHLSPGIYFLRIGNESERSVVKFLKQ